MTDFVVRVQIPYLDLQSPQYFEHRGAKSNDDSKQVSTSIAVSRLDSRHGTSNAQQTQPLDQANPRDLDDETPPPRLGPPSPPISPTQPNAPQVMSNNEEQIPPHSQRQHTGSTSRIADLEAAYGIFNGVSGVQRTFTLDQSFYNGLKDWDLVERNKRQIVSKWHEILGSGGPGPGLLMVNQLWLWKVDDGRRSVHYQIPASTYLSGTRQN